MLSFYTQYANIKMRIKDITIYDVIDTIFMRLIIIIIITQDARALREIFVTGSVLIGDQ